MIKNIFQHLVMLVIIQLTAITSSNAQTCNAGDIVISSGTTVAWNTSTKPNPYTITQNVCVEGGGTLNISGLNIKMNGLLYITVHKGGTLNISGSILQPLTSSNSWGGIIVMGDNDQPLCDEVNQTLNTTNHGFVSLESSTIESANYGLKLTGYGDNLSGGGIIKVNNCTFHNNSIAGIYMGSYEIPGSQCFVNSVANSTFMSDNISKAPYSYIKMVSYKGFTVLGCNFNIPASSKFNTIGISISERSTSYLQAGKLILEASEFVNPYDYQSSSKFSTPKRNTFFNLRTGIEMFGNQNDITPFESIIKNCDFNKVGVGIDIRHAQSVAVMCNNYIASIYDENNSANLKMNYTEYEEDGLGGLTKISTQLAPDPYSIFAYCNNTYGDVNFYNNTCEWNNDFVGKQAYGIIYNWHKEIDFPSNYAVSGNTFTCTATEGNDVRGILIHGNFTYGTQLIANQFSKLYRDIHLKGFIRPAGATIFNPVIDPQGERTDYSSFPPTNYTTGNGNVFSDPSIDAQGNIFSDATATFYVSTIAMPPPNFDPYRHSSSVAVYSSSTGLNDGPYPADCTIPQPSGLLSDGRLFGLYKPSACLKVYPNPASDIVNIEWENNMKLHDAEIVVYNTMLQTVYATTIEEGQTSIMIDDKQFSEGLYFVVLKKEGETICINKLIKQ